MAARLTNKSNFKFKYVGICWMDEIASKIFYLNVAYKLFISIIYIITISININYDNNH
jgi:hypothetical protein